jgi:hypothetical protein
VVDIIEPGHVTDVCVPVVDQLCSACTGDAECTQVGMDRCLTYPDGKVHHFEGKRAPLLLDRKAPAWGEPVMLFDGKTLTGWKLVGGVGRLVFVTTGLPYNEKYCTTP